MNPKSSATRKLTDSMFLKGSGRRLNLNFGNNIEARTNSPHARSGTDTLNQVGDYGLVDTETDDFEFHGNIYKDDAILKLLPELRDDEYQPQMSEPMNHWITTANGTQQGEFDAGSVLSFSL
jgi:hypothetical protein